MPEREFELRLASVLREDAERAVRPFDAVVLAVEARRAPRPDRLTRSILRTLAYAALAAALIAGAVIVDGTPPNDPPAPTPTVRVPVLLGADGRLLGASTWAADADLTAELGVAGRIHLVIGYGGATASVRGVDGGLLLASDVDGGPEPGQLRFTLLNDSAGCAADDVGTYLATRAQDGLRIELEVIDDACAARSSALARTWHRSLMLDSAGGTGLLDPFAPAIRVTVPAAEWSTAVFDEGLALGSDNLGIDLLVMKDPQGVTEPCAEQGGAPVDIGRGSGAFAAYLDGLPGVDVATEPAVVATYPGLRLTATSTRDPDCPATRSMVAWRTSSGQSIHLLSGSLTGEDLLLLIDGPGGTFLIGIPEEPSILDSLEFVTELTGSTGPAP